METNNDSYEQMFRQEVAQESINDMAKKQEAESKKKKRLIFTAFGAFVVLVVTVIFIITFSVNKGSEEIKKTPILSLYEQLDDGIKYGDLEKIVKEIAPGAIIVFEDGTYTIKEEEGDDYIVCYAEVEMKDLVENAEAETEGANLIESESEATENANSDEDADMDEEELNIEPALLELEPKLLKTTTMIDFTYYAYGDVKTSNGISVMDLSIEKNDTGYVFHRGAKTIEFSTKTAAVSALSDTLRAMAETMK